MYLVRPSRSGQSYASCTLGTPRQPLCTLFAVFDLETVHIAHIGRIYNLLRASRSQKFDIFGCGRNLGIGLLAQL